ncbi:MAG: hypothetical protein AW07_01421 [Candidatus Accumulibacter sp. SK-11]|nr:MAG: hypothetical protein AW07_01421 [Candidatus Accumulibacter sp. SK-11]
MLIYAVRWLFFPGAQRDAVAHRRIAARHNRGCRR